MIIKRLGYQRIQIKIGLLVFVSTVLSFCPTTFPQAVIDAKPGLISCIIGDTRLDEETIHIAHQNYPVLKEGQVLRTARGRAEILLGPSTFLRLGEFSDLRLVSAQSEDVKAELIRGSAVVEILKSTYGKRVGMQIASTKTEFMDKGVYRFDADPAMLRVYGGSAEVSVAEKKVRVRSGKAMYLIANLSASKFPVKKADALHMWAAERSLVLFTSNPEALTTQFNWTITASGWSSNRDFHVRLYSPVIAEVYAQRRVAEAFSKAKDKQHQDRVDALVQQQMREIAQQKAQEQLQRQQQNQQPTQQPQNSRK
jgi:hypothetical protein